MQPQSNVSKDDEVINEREMQDGKVVEYLKKRAEAKDQGEVKQMIEGMVQEKLEESEARR